LDFFSASSPICAKFGSPDFAVKGAGFTTEIPKEPEVSSDDSRILQRNIGFWASGFSNAIALPSLDTHLIWSKLNLDGE
jgi:hypothetical protein